MRHLTANFCHVIRLFFDDAFLKVSMALMVTDTKTRGHGLPTPLVVPGKSRGLKAAQMPSS